MRMSLASLLFWAIGPALLVGLVGAYPTWRFAGQGGLAGQATAACIVILAMAASAAVVVRKAVGGAAKAAVAFLLTASVRIGICLVLGLAAAFLLPLSTAAMLAWLGVFYVVSLLGECAWLTRAIRRSVEGSTGGGMGASVALK
jgi:hypothetical protein